MRTLLLALGVVLVLSVTVPCRAEFDSGGSSVVLKFKPEASFDGNIASKRVTALNVKVTAFDVKAWMKRRGLVGIEPNTQQPAIKNPSNIPRPKR
jgi:hypothetical protein